MALNPLSFSVGVKDEASKPLEDINNALNNLVSKLDSIKNIAISLGGDPGEAESLMKSLNGVAASLASISKLSPEAQAASDRLTASQQKLNEATEMYNNLLAKIKSENPAQVFLDATKKMNLGANFDTRKANMFGGLEKLEPEKWAEHLKQYLMPSKLSTADIEGNVQQFIVNIRNIMAKALSGNGPDLSKILEESFNFNSVNQKLNDAFAKLREEYIKGMNQLKDVEANKNGLAAIEGVLPGLRAQVEAAQKEFDALKNAASATTVNPESFKGAEGAIAATNEATKMLGDAINKLDFSKINTALDQLAERLNKLVTELAGIEERMKTAFTGALEANVTSLGNVIDGLAKKMAAMSTPMSEGMKQGEQATNAQTEAIKKQEEELLSIQKKLQRLQEIREQAVGTISELRSAYGSKPNRDWWENPSMKDAVEKDRKAQESAIDALEKKWEAYWRKQEQGAQNFANSIGKALKDVNWGDFEKHLVGPLSEQAKSWYRVKMHELYDIPGMKSEAHRLKSFDDQYQNEIKLLEALIRKVSEYGNAKNKAYSASPNQDAAVSKTHADELAYYKSWGLLSAANKERRKLLDQEAEAQQKLNELKSQGSSATEKQVQSEQQQAQATKELGQSAGQTAEQLQKLAQSTVGEAFNQLAASLNKIKELFDNLGKAEGLTQLNNTINGVNTAVEALAKTLSNVNNAVKFTGSTEEIAAYEAKIKSLQEQVAALEAKAKGLGETAKAASEQMKTVTASGGGGGSSKDGLTEAQLKRVNDQLQLLEKRLSTIEPNYNKAKELGFSDEVIEGKIKHLKDYIAALNEATKAGSLSGIKVGGEYSLFSRAANEDVPTQAQAQKMAKQMQEYIAIQQQAQAEAERQAQAQERMRQAAEAAGMSIVKAGEQTQSAGQQSETAKQQMHGFNEEILVNMRSWEQAGQQMAVFEKRIFAVMAQLQSGKALGFDTGNLQSDIQELMRFYAIMKEIRNNNGFANIEGSMLTTSKVLKESGLDFGQMWEKNKQELTAVKTIYEQMVRLQALANNKNALPTDNLNTKYQREALENALRAQDIMAKLKSVDLRQATALVGGQDYQQATAAIEAFFRTYNQNANIAKSQTAELQRLLEKIQGTDKGGGWINVMKAAGVSEDKINEMRQIAEKIQRAIAALEQSRQMGTAADFVRSDWYRATVVEGKKANDTGYLAVREAHERTAAEREAAKATQESAKAAEKKREEMSKAWREQEAARQKEAAAAEASLQKQMAAEEKARQKSIDDAWKAADQKIKADQHAAQERERAIQQATKEEIKGYEQAVKAEQAKERAMSKRFAAEQEAARKAQQEKDKLYGAAGLRENDPGIKNMTAQLDAFMQRINQVREVIGNERDLLSKGLIGEESAIKVIRWYEEELATLMRQYEALYQARAALSAQVPFAETQRSVKNVELEQLGEKYRQEAKAADEAAQAKKRDAENSMAAGKAISDLSVKIDKYKNSLTFKKAQELKIDTSDYERAIKRLERFKKVLEYVNSDAGSHHKPSLISGVGATAENEVKMQEAALKRLVSAQQQTASETQQLTSEQQRLAQALNQTTEHARGQSQVLSDLKMMATQYLGVWGAQQFLHNIIEIGGQLEMQRMSIGAILQNQSQANDLFEKIKGLARQSPFGVVELDQMTKQLTAYGFKYNELFDMTKRLADISAATGTGVDRLALALGHVRSEAALSGYTLRQFSMGNVPLLQKLAEKLGKTTAEIRKMVRTKEISYEDVEGVIKDLTNEGGMFYNMQEVISESVKARFKNVKDSMAIMYGEMAEGATGDALKGVADALMDITKNWKDAATVIGTGAAVWGIQRAAIMAYTAMIGKSTVATLASIHANIKKQGVMLQLANKYRVLTTAERDLLNASRANSAMIRMRTLLGMNYTKKQGEYIAAQRTIITNSLALKLSEGKLTVAELAHMVATRKLTHEEARLIITNSSLDASMKSSAMSIIGSTRQLNMLGLAFRRVGMAIKSFMGSLAAFAPMVIITGLMELWQRNKREMEAADEMANNIYEKSKDALENTRRMMEETSITKIDAAKGLTADNIQIPEFDHETAKGVMDQWTQYIREYAGTPNKLINDALATQEGEVASLTEQYKKLSDAVKTVIEAQEKLGDMSDIFASAQKGTDSGWFDDDVATDIKQYIDARKDLRREIGKHYRENMKNADAGIKMAREQDEAFRISTEGMRNEAEMLLYLAENWQKYGDAVRAYGQGSGENTDWLKNAGNKLKSQKDEMDIELRRYYTGLQDGLLALGENPQALSPAAQQAVLIGFKSFLDNLGNMSEQEYKERLEDFKKYFKITLDDAQENANKSLMDWQRRAKDSFEVNTTIKLKATTESDINEFAKLVQKDLKEKQDYVANMQNHMREIILKMPINVQPSMKITTDAIRRVMNELTNKILELTKGGKTSELANQLMSQLFDELMPFYETLQSIEEDKKWLKQEGFPETDPSKNKNKNKTDKKYRDKEVEQWKERLKNLKAAYDEYKKLEEEFGQTEALERVKRQFKGLIDEKDIENIEKYKEQVVELKNKALNRYLSQKGDKSKDYGKQAQQLVRESEKAITDYDITEQKRKSDEYVSKLKLQLDELKRQWETFNKVRMATNNEKIAAQVAGLSQDQTSKRDIANSVKANIQGIIKEMGGEVKVPIEFDVTSSDKDIENNVKAALGGSKKYREQIKSIVEAIKTWRDLERDAMQKSVDAYTQAISKAMDYESQLARINAELEEQNRLVDKNNNLSQEQKDRAKGINQANASMKALEASDSYKRFFNGIFGETKTELQGMAKTIKSHLNFSLEKGAITAENYAKKVKEIDDVMKNSIINDTDAWYNSGIFDTRDMQKRIQDRYDSGFEDYQKGANMYQMGLNSGDEAMQKAGQDMMQNGKDMMQGASKAAIAMAIIDKVVHGIDQSIQGTVKAFDYIKEALDALGVESDTMSSVGDYLHSLGEMSSHVTQSWDNFKSGNFIGAGVEAIGAVTSIIKGFSQAHDNRLERAITKLREDVKAIEANTELIAKSRERTLGYDMGSVRRQMAQQYAPQTWKGQTGASLLARLMSGGFDTKQQKAMYEFYTKNSQGTGYQQEYDNLVEQRKKYLEILKDQQAKKKKSNDEIEETKAKIAELDDQIAYFSQDLAKELWSIDIKGWADQLSDALASAFENGENMAKAYRDTVTQIIQQMMQKMMQMAILEPMFERLQKQLFGENGKGGVFDPNNPKGSMSKVTAMIADFFGKGGEGEKAITASMEFMTAFQRGMQNAGLTVLNEASNTLSSSMQGTTEETSGLLAGYVNALRQDVSVNRILLTQFVSQMWPDYIEQFASQVTAVQNIDTNVQVIMTMMQMGNGAMYDEIAAMRARIDNVVMGIDRFAVK